MKSKRAMELSINFIVVLIISIVVFAFGIQFAYRLMHDADELSIDMLDDLEQSMEKLRCDSSDLVCIGMSSKEIRVHRTDIFTLGIMNTYDKEQTFSIKVENGLATLRDGTELPTHTIATLTRKSVAISPNKQELMGIAVKVPGGTKPGTYVINVYVCKGSVCTKESDHYGTVQKLYVNVP